MQLVQLVKTPAGIHAEKGVAGTSWSILPLKANKHYLHRQILRGTIEHFHWFDIQVLGWMVLMWFQRHNQAISHFWEIVCTHGLTDYHRSQWYGGTRNNAHAGQQCGGNGIQPECIPVSPINKPLLLSGQLNGHILRLLGKCHFVYFILPSCVSWDAGQKSDDKWCMVSQEVCAGVHQQYQPCQWCP